MHAANSSAVFTSTPANTKKRRVDFPTHPLATPSPSSFESPRKLTSAAKHAKTCHKSTTSCFHNGTTFPLTHHQPSHIPDHIPDLHATLVPTITPTGIVYTVLGSLPPLGSHIEYESYEKRIRLYQYLQSNKTASTDLAASSSSSSVVSEGSRPRSQTALFSPAMSAPSHPSTLTHAVIPILPTPQPYDYGAALVNAATPTVTLSDSYLFVYGSDYFNELKRGEEATMPSMYLSSHSSLTQSMRGILIDWLIELTLEYNLSPTTLYHAVSLVDRSLSHLPPVPRAQLQCLGCACMLVSSKLHEIHPPTADDFVYISDSTYTRGQITSTESAVCAALSFNLTAITAISYLPLFEKAAKLTPPIVNLYRYIMELTLLDYRYLPHPPSLIAAGALLVTLTMNKLPWTDTVSHYTSYTPSSVKGVALQLISTMWLSEDSSLKTVYSKYKGKKWGEVSLRTVPRKEEIDLWF